MNRIDIQVELAVVGPDSPVLWERFEQITAQYNAEMKALPRRHLGQPLPDNYDTMMDAARATEAELHLLHSALHGSVHDRENPDQVAIAATWQAAVDAGKSRLYPLMAGDEGEDD
jgi:hypothetical protein